MKTIAGIIRQLAARPDGVAINDRGVDVSYRELLERAMTVAGYVEQHKKTHEEIVIVCMEQSADAVATIIGVLLAGAAYLPIALSTPESRVSEIVRQTGARLTIVDDELVGNKFTNPTHINDIYTSGSGHGRGVVADDASANRLAYIIYTSGSTGVPKGVMIEHHSLDNIVDSFVELFGVSSHDRVLQLTNYSFDASVAEIFPILGVGGTMVIPARDVSKSIRLLLKAVEDNGVTIFGAVPSILRVINKLKPRLSTVRLINSGGEKLYWGDIDHLLKSASVTNGYGPTETTVCSNVCICAPHATGTGQVSIGFPLKNYEVLIVDGDQIAEEGQIGEIVVGGAGVGRGYLHDEQLTNDRFVYLPKVSKSRLYRTGDLGKWNAVSGLEFVGRIDGQVKINGNRVELGDIENCLYRIPEITNAVCIAEEDKTALTSLFVFYQSEREMDQLAIYELLRKHLPAYMIPNRVVWKSSFPVLPSGKINKRDLLASLC
jgi:amino acid adenylation domain-containing protein